MSNDVIITLISVVIGGALVMLSNYLIYYFIKADEIKKVAKAFHIELLIYKDWLKDITNKYPKDEITDTSSYSELRRLSLDEITSLNRPIFDKQSIFYIFRKEMFLFKIALYNDLLTFYSLLMGAEELRRRFIYIWDDSASRSSRVADLINYKIEIINNYNKALDILPKIERELQNIHKEQTSDLILNTS